MMKYSVTSLLAGLIFGLGLMVSGMANPEKVLGFLDIAGLWDPSLAFVMGGAIIVGLVAFAVARRRTLSFLGFTMKMPANNRIEPRLVIGSMMFGIGWGIAGICPGPAIAVLLSGHWQVLLFVLAMLGGMLLFSALERRRVC